MHRRLRRGRLHRRCFHRGPAAFDMHAREWLVGVVLRCQSCGDGFEVFQVFGSPPVADAALGVEGCPSESKVWLISWPMMVPMAP